jgi:hypothetical protein
VALFRFLLRAAKNGAWRKCAGMAESAASHVLVNAQGGVRQPTKSAAVTALMRNGRHGGETGGGSSRPHECVNCLLLFLTALWMSFCTVLFADVHASGRVADAMTTPVLRALISAFPCRGGSRAR